MPSPHLALDLWTVLVDKRTVKRLTERVGVLQAPLYSVKQDQIDCEIKAVSIPMYLSFYHQIFTILHIICIKIWKKIDLFKVLQLTCVNPVNAVCSPYGTRGMSVAK